MVAGPGVAPHGLVVAESGRIGHSDRHRRPHTVVHAESEGAGDDDYLERGEADGSDHAGHDSGYRERAGLKRHLKRDGP